MLNAQFNAKTIHVNAKEGAISTVSLKSFGIKPNIISTPLSGSDSLGVHHVSGFDYELHFAPTSGYMGDAKVIIEYFEVGPIPGIPFRNYTTVNYKVKSSSIHALTDHVLCTSDSLVIDILSNDSSSDGDLSIDRLGFVEGGTANINGSGDLVFEFDAGSDIGYVRYFAVDSTGNSEGCIAHLIKEDRNAIATEHLYVDNKSDLVIQLPSAEFEISNGANYGTVTSSGNHVWEYRANNSFVGVDTVSFTSASGGSIDYIVEVVNKFNSNTFVVDDQFAVESNGSISFNVFDNDLRNDKSIIDYSSELTYNGDGDFIYNAPQGFTGDKTFFYKIYSDFAFHYGNITIHVDTYAPITNLDYEFEILEDHDLKLVHSSPIESYYFSILTPPTNGEVIVLDSGDAEVLECANVTGANTIVYIPNAGFNGIEEFELEYCTDSGICEIVKIDVNVLDTNYEDCLCINGCVYSGDVNDDGVVDVKDILDLGLNIGEAGYERIQDFNLIWTGQESDNWGYDQMNDGIDLKCGDTDGDGYIDAYDAYEIKDNYGRIHSLRSNSIEELSTVPIYFIPPSNPVDSGEWISLDIVVGNANLPAVDFYGTAFTLNFDPELMDSASVKFTLYDDNWMGYQSPITQIATVPQDGQVDIGISRISNVSTDGLGVIGKLEFIVEDEVSGLKKRSQLQNSSLVTMSKIISTNEFGQYMTHPNFEDHILFNEDPTYNDEDLEQSIVVSPNPTTGIFTIESEKYNIDRIDVVDALGRAIFTTQKTYSQFYNLDISSYNQGVYFVRISSHGKTTVEKIQKIDL